MTLARLAMCASMLAVVAPLTAPPSPAHAEPPAALASHACASARSLRAPSFAASTLRQGRFVYRETTGSGDTSTFTIEIRPRADGSWRFTGEGSGQRWEAIADSAFRPRSAQLSMQRRGRPYGFQLRYEGDSVFASETHDSVPGSSNAHSPAAIHGVTIDQRIDWASLMASDLAVGQSVAYAVFDPATGSSVLAARASDGPTLAGPDGRQPTVKLDYTICKAGASEPYTVFATKEKPRTMLREDMRGNLVAELIRIEW